MLLAGLLAVSLPALISEPDSIVHKQDGKWRISKPRLRVAGAPQQPGSWVLYERPSRDDVEERRRALPRLRLSSTLYDYNPGTRERTPIVNWTGQSDAIEAETDIRLLIERFASPIAARLLDSTPIHMARLYGASGHTAEEARDPTRYVVYFDPYRATSRLHAAATIVHELAHVERYRARGFHANRAARVLSRADFILLGLADELAAYAVEAAFVRAALESLGDSGAKSAMTRPELRWPHALLSLLGLTPEPAREQVASDLRAQAGRYWDVHRRTHMNRALAASIEEWYRRSPEWKEIAAQRDLW